MKYTKKGEHPEDVIFRAGSFLSELSKLQEHYFQELVQDLELNEEGEIELFDYLYNQFQDTNLSFEEALDERGIEYTSLLLKKSKK